MPTSARDTHRGKRADVGIGPYDRYRKVFDKSEFVFRTHFLYRVFTNWE
jgi:hypothetical protein